ncbi:peptidase [Mycena metata]|uniref:Peptide hydrolase n=1 Tax=Mycena metata TaxID=1033252 RepID=A0AAD7NZF9_9AGAR|nr:peptidase [Mycena metata]
MKSLFALVALAVVANSSPINGEQVPLGLESFPGFSLDLTAQRLVEMQGQPPVWMSELEKIQAKQRGIKFFDITDTRELGTVSRLQVKASFPSPNATEKVKPILKTLSTKGPEENLREFTSFRTRHYRSDTGRQSQVWLKKRISEITAQWGSKSLQNKIKISEFSHSWGQNSIIVRINGSSYDRRWSRHNRCPPGLYVNSTPRFSARLIALTFHPETCGLFSQLLEQTTDGSGSVTILESYRALLAADFHPVRSIEFHWYSAEEGGLLGSQAVAQAYEGHVNVVAMSQFDMTAWVKRGTREEVGLIMDFVDLPLTEFNKQLVDLYLDIPWVETKCGYACSDHASWRKAGYPSSFTIESTFENSNQNIHSAKDHIDVSDEFSFLHMLEFSKLAVAFAVELGSVSN